MVSNRRIQQIDAILGKLTKEFNKSKNKNARERPKKELKKF